MSGYILCMSSTSSEWWATLSTTQYLPFAEGTSYARTCASATSLTFIHPMATLGYVEDDPARKFEEFLVNNQTEIPY